MMIIKTDTLVTLVHIFWTKVFLLLTVGIGALHYLYLTPFLWAHQSSYAAELTVIFWLLLILVGGLLLWYWIYLVGKLAAQLLFKNRFGI